MAKVTEKVLQATIKVKDNYTKQVEKATKSAKKFEKASKSIKPVVLKAKDMASKILNKVSGKLKSFGRKAYTATVKVKDAASSVLGKLKSTMGLLAAGVTIGVGVKMIAGGAMDLEEQQVSMNHFMGLGNKGKDSSTINKMTNDYMKELRNNANATPFETGEVVAAGTRALGLSNGNTKEAMKLVKLAEDMAALTPGKTISDAMEALADSNMGEMERLKEFNYKGSSKDDPKQTIANLTKTFEGGAEKLSKTAKGKFSTSMGTLKSGLADFGTAFLPIMSSTFDKVTNMLNKVSPGLLQFSQKVADGLDKFSKSKDASLLLDMFKSVATTVFNAVGTTIDTCRPFIEKVFNFLMKNSPTITLFIETLGSIWNGFWKTAGSLLNSAWEFIQPGLQGMVDIVNELLKAVKGAFEWWGKMVDKIKKNPITQTIGKVNAALNGGGNGNDGNVGSRGAYGIRRVTGNDVPYRLHDGERVLSKNEANQYNKSNNGITINMSGITVNNGMDIKEIANTLVTEIKKAKLTYGGVY